MDRQSAKRDAGFNLHGHSAEFAKRETVVRKDAPKGGEGGRGVPPLAAVELRGPQARGGPTMKARGTGRPLPLRTKNGLQGPTKHPKPQQGPPGASWGPRSSANGALWRHKARWDPG